MSLVKTEVLCLLKDVKNQIERAKEIEQTVESLTYLHDHIETNEAISRQFSGRLYIEFCEYLIRDVTARWTDESYRKLQDCLAVFFMRGPAEDSFLVLTKSLSSDSHTTAVKTALGLLESWLSRGRMSELIKGKTSLVVDGNEKRNLQRNLSGFDEKLMSRLVALPDIAANQVNIQERSQLSCAKYYKLLAESILDVLRFTYENMKDGHDCSLVFANAVFGKACLQGHSNAMMTVLLPSFASFAQSDPLWRRICQRFLTVGPDCYIESIITSLLTKINPSFGEECLVSHLVGDVVLTSSKVKFLLTHKLILTQFYSKVSVLLNIIFYLAGSDTRRQLMIETLMKVIDVWGDASALNHSSYEQHFYITQAVHILTRCLTKDNVEEHGQALLLKLIHGVHSHLKCSVEKVRRLGLVAGECLTKLLDSSGKKLEFEYEVDDDVMLLKLLCGSFEDMKKYLASTDEVSSVEKDQEKQMKPGVELPVDMKPANGDSDDDSDDGLQPYALPDESHDFQRKGPVYLRDVVTGLLCQDDRDRTEASLLVAEKVIRSQPDNLDEVAVELVKILLHMQDTYSLDGFFLLRHNAMVAATVLCPRQVVPYLTKQFYERNFNLRQRLDMLEVLSSAATELSIPNKSSNQEQAHNVVPLIRELHKESSVSRNWQEIIRERVEAKTRRFVKGPSTSLPQPVPNRFGPVAGLFFFPLMEKYDSCCATIDMMGEDHLMLGRLISTLAVIMHASANTPAARQMAIALMEFVFAIRYHSERYVRQALLYAICMVLCSLPPAVLLSDLQSELVETHAWLEDVLSHDPDAKSQELALQTTVLLESILKESISQ
ncbi:telomere length regulation protein TEL2 homolog [Corticium candelabrum]|uniref:telomere length regulation protein TEL2 homolog n=1 Tax=Corticium candelabrum TaxID=121492 RepID=UPI002E30DA27|nr:telomere length regulation protein TEL2 homolog [Corticium candelabrum]